MPVLQPLERRPGETDAQFAARNDRRMRHNASSKQSKRKAITQRNARREEEAEIVRLCLPPPPPRPEQSPSGAVTQQSRRQQEVLLQQQAYDAWVQLREERRQQLQRSMSQQQQQPAVGAAHQAPVIYQGKVYDRRPGVGDRAFFGMLINLHKWAWWFSIDMLQRTIISDNVAGFVWAPGALSYAWREFCVRFTRLVNKYDQMDRDRVPFDLHSFRVELARELVSTIARHRTGLMGLESFQTYERFIEWFSADSAQRLWDPYFLHPSAHSEREWRWNNLSWTIMEDDACHQPWTSQDQLDGYARIKAGIQITYGQVGISNNASPLGICSSAASFMVFFGPSGDEMLSLQLEVLNFPTDLRILPATVRVARGPDELRFEVQQMDLSNQGEDLEPFVLDPSLVPQGGSS